MIESLTNVSVRDKTEEREHKATEYALTATKIGAAAIFATLMPASPLTAIISLAVAEGLGLTISHMGEQWKQRREQQAWEMWGHLLEKVSQQQICAKQDNEQYQDIVFDGVIESMRAKEKERIKMIAGIIASATIPDSNLFEAKMHLALLKSLDELDLVVLVAMKNAEALYPPDGKTSQRSAIPAVIIGDAALSWSGLHNGNAEDLPATLTTPLVLSLSKLKEEKLLRWSGLASQDNLSFDTLSQNHFLFMDRGVTLLSFLEND